MRYSKLLSQVQYLIVLLIAVFSFNLQAVETVKNIRIWPSPDSTRVVLDLSAPIKYTYFSLNNPQRLVIDLQNTRIKSDLASLKHDSKLLSNIRSSSEKSGDARLVLDLSKKVEPMVFSLKPTGPYGNRLVIDLVDSKAKVANTERRLEKDRDIIIAIDAGHGGEDPGSIGGKGNYEKRVTFDIAKKLETLINKEKGLKAVLTRTGDYFVSVSGRSERARQANADLLVSIHADAFTSPKPSGAAVWILSPRRANSEIGKWLENKEKQSELLGGAAEVINNSSTEKYLARTLLDMSMDHSMEEGYEVAKDVLNELKKITKLHKSTPQSASLGVLKAPDIPSILVETGFISNPREEKLLINNWFQSRMADSIFVALQSYFKRNPPDNSYYVRYKSIQHKVKPGESLSLVAQNYNVSVSDIKKANRLRTNTIRVGQVLAIPRT